MISHGKNIKIFSGNSHPALAMQIASALGLPIGKAAISTFADGEISVSMSESVRGSDVFLVQSTCGPVNNNLMELLIMIDAFRRASAGRITAVIPYFGYARQDRKAKGRDPISAKLVANLITRAGADRVLTMDLPLPHVRGQGPHGPCHRGQAPSARQHVRGHEHHRRRRGQDLHPV